MSECQSGKVCFKSKHGARHCMRSKHRKGARLRVYLCECGFWHLSGHEKNTRKGGYILHRWNEAG